MGRTHLLLCVLLCVALAPLAALLPQALAETDTVKPRKILDVPYHKGPSADPLHKLDLYLPKTKNAFPVLIYIHGGGWSEGDKQDHHALPCVALTDDGFGFVSINYRLTPHVMPPKNIEDCAKAVAWVIANISKYGGNPDQLFLAGHSAGGHLAAMVALNPAYLRAAGVTHQPFKGAIPISGGYLFNASKAKPDRWLLERFGPVENWERLSPLTYVTKDDPKLLILSSEQDGKGQPKLLADAFAKIGRHEEVLEIKNRDHTTIMHGIANPDDPARQAIVRFMRQQLTKRPTPGQPPQP